MLAFSAAALTVAFLTTLVSGHAHMVKPLGMLVPESNFPWPEVPDYNIDNSLFLNGTNYPCKGYHHSPLVKVTENLEAGTEYPLEIQVGAPHEGGTCELALSYDNGFTFRVFKRFIGGCPAGYSKWTAKYKIPEYAPSGDKVLFSWTWLALTGVVEMWQTCSYVTIKGIHGKEDKARFKALPPVWRGALHEFNPLCVTEDHKHLIPPLTDGVEIEISPDQNGFVPTPENSPYTFPPGLCDNDDIISASWAYDKMDGMNGGSCIWPPLLPCTETTGWPTRGSFIQACKRHDPPVGWLEWPIECDGQGLPPPDAGDGDGDGDHGGHHGGHGQNIVAEL